MEKTISSLLDWGSNMSLITQTYFEKHFLSLMKGSEKMKMDAHKYFNL